MQKLLTEGADMIWAVQVVHRPADSFRMRGMDKVKKIEFDDGGKFPYSYYPRYAVNYSPPSRKLLHFRLRDSGSWPFRLHAVFHLFVWIFHKVILSHGNFPSLLRRLMLNKDLPSVRCKEFSNVFRIP